MSTTTNSTVSIHKLSEETQDRLKKLGLTNLFATMENATKYVESLEGEVLIPVFVTLNSYIVARDKEEHPADYVCLEDHTATIDSKDNNL